MNDPLEKLLKKNGAFVLRQRKRPYLPGRCTERDSRGVYHGTYSVQFQQPRRVAHDGSHKSGLESKSASTSLHGGWKNAKTEPPPPNTDVEVYCKALGVTVGYHRPLMDEWLTDDHRTLRNVTHWRPIPPPPPEAEP